MSQWIDITRPIDDAMITWPGRTPPKRQWEKRIVDGHHCNVSYWEMSAHSGTHMDAPLHFVEAGKSIDQISPDVFIGECRVCDLSQAEGLVGTRRLLIKSGDADKPYAPLMTERTAKRLIDGGLVLIGTERLSVDDSSGQSFALHQLFLGAGVVIVEGLQLVAVKAGTYNLHAAPLRIAGMEASPIRALLGTSTG